MRRSLQCMLLESSGGDLTSHDNDRQEKLAIDQRGRNPQKEEGFRDDLITVQSQSNQPKLKILSQR